MYACRETGHKLKIILICEISLKWPFNKFASYMLGIKY